MTADTQTYAFSVGFEASMFDSKALVSSSDEMVLAFRPSTASASGSLVRSVMTYSTTLGTTKKPSADLGALDRTWGGGGGGA
ncbi:hypothetical protein ACWKV8_15285, partial [Brevundimonas diminuta ATCC 11568]